MATYTTAALVRKRAENLDSSLTDGDIEDYIEEAEQILNTIMGASFLSSFDAAKHGIVRSGCNAWACSCAIIYNPDGFTDIREVNTILDVLNRQWSEVNRILANRQYVGYLESL